MTDLGDPTPHESRRLEEIAARALNRKARDELLMNYAACIRAREDAAAIIDVEGVVGFILRKGEREIARTLCQMRLDPRGFAFILRDGLVAQFERQAAVFKRLAQDNHGATDDELRQAVRDFELISAQRAAAAKIGGAEAGE